MLNWKLSLDWPEGTSPTVVAASLQKLAAKLQGEAAELTEEKTEYVAGEKVEAKKVGRPPKAKPEQVPSDEQYDLGFPEEKKAAPAKALQLEDVIEGFKKFAIKNGREAAVKLLGSYGVKSVKDLKPATFEEIMTKLG